MNLRDQNAMYIATIIVQLAPEHVAAISTAIEEAMLSKPDLNEAIMKAAQAIADKQAQIKKRLFANRSITADSDADRREANRHE